MAFNLLKRNAYRAQAGLQGQLIIKKVSISKDFNIFWKRKTYSKTDLLFPFYTEIKI